MRKRNSNMPAIAWLDVLKRIQNTAAHLGAPEEVLDASSSSNTGWRTRGNTMFMSVPAVLRDFVEEHLDEFKPVLWPFLLSHHCTKLIYE